MFDILLTGANGFIGKKLHAALIAQDFKVLTLTREDGDVALWETWSKIPKASFVIHLAGLTSVVESWNKVQNYFMTNLIGTIQAMEYCKLNNASLIFMSSYMYGVPQSLPIDENAPTSVNNPYALSKKNAEDVAKFYANNFSIPVTVLRLFNVVGEGQGASFLLPMIIEMVRQKRIIVKDLEPKRDYVYIDDVIDAIVLAVKKKKQGFSLYNIASGKSFSVREVIDMIEEIMHEKFEVEVTGDVRKNEIPDSRADISRVQDELQWTPKWQLKDILTKMLKDQTDQ